MTRKYCNQFAFAALTWVSAVLVSADVVQTKDGARLVGAIKGVNGGTVVLDTSYAGTLSIKQSEVVSMETAQPDSVRLASGTRIDGKVTTAANGAVQVVGADGTVTTTVANVAMIWPAGTRDPSVGAWAYEATLDVAGTSGNKSSLATGAGFKAALVNPKDALKFYGNYNRAVTEGIKSAELLRLGVDYANTFGVDQQWFVRDEGGFDHVMGVRYEDVAAAGYGFDFAKTAEDLLVGRVGVGYRYTAYSTPATPNVSTAVGDLEINHSFKGRVFEVSNSLAFVPSFDDFADFLVTHDSYVQVPLANTSLKFRAGLSNNYNSRPGKGVKKMDTLYYLRLVYDFGAAAAP